MTGPLPPASDQHLAAEVLALARALIRVDTSNAPEAALGRPPGQETPAAELLAAALEGTGVEVQLVAREDARANLVARLPGSDPDAPSLAFVGHSDVVPADARDWTHPPFEAVVDDDGWLWGRGAVDMKNEVAARTVALAELARTGFRPRGDLWLVVVADEEDGTAEVGMRWLLEQRPDVRPTWAVNEGGGLRLNLTDGRTVLTVSTGEKGTYPVRVVARGEAGHASMPSVGRNAVVILGELLTRVGQGMPEPLGHPALDTLLAQLNGAPVGPGPAGLEAAVRKASLLHPALAVDLAALVGTTMAPTLLAGSTKRNVMPARASVELDCRLLPGTTEADVEAAVRRRLGDDLPYDLEWPESLVPGSVSPWEGDHATPLSSAMAEVLAARGETAELLPVLTTGFTDSVYLRAAGDVVAYGFTPLVATPAEVVSAGFHNADERVHVDDLLHGVRFHLDLARRLLG
ncbi:M20/M25/M40 family metallo-hydrolase [Nocardioides sp. GY 10127]|uniref:M20/M25/M40 family metallo-hydrolase n=1 Tax=Nocardioides sp. GY 10127 TaxID=2569762 RepID=UPI0010A9443A|nr:M20/M25/M40 family metallo-hydrolase [Nocardioides sp. GY 10127]TIC86610.1 M20/M25/M40 family metallo-hydrolase [Nocardioides sp. GY 10127]